jgi:hypothetical protein
MDHLIYQPVPYNLEEELRESMKDEEFRKEYEALEPKNALIRELLFARQQSGLTQEAVGCELEIRLTPKKAVLHP